MSPTCLVLAFIFLACVDGSEYQCAEQTSHEVFVHENNQALGNQLIQTESAVGNLIVVESGVLTNQELAAGICSLIHGKCSTFPKTINCASTPESIDSTFLNDFNTAASTAGITEKKEAFSFIANAIQETGCFDADEEYEGNDKKKYDYHGNEANKVCDASCTCPKAAECDRNHDDCQSKCKNHYYGRGYLQLTWHANYYDAQSTSGFGLTGLVDDPSIAKNKAWDTAAWFWQCRVQRSSCTESTRGLVHLSDSHMFSASTFYINGWEECPNMVEDVDGVITCRGTSNGVKNATNKQHAYCRMYYFKTMYEAVEGGTVTVDNCCFDTADYTSFAAASHCK